jgi:hypothetical protein
MMSGVRKQFDVSRLMAELTALKVEMLSAQCAMDRVRLQYAPQGIVEFGERQALKRIIASAQAIHRFCSEIEDEIKRQESAKTE